VNVFANEIRCISRGMGDEAVELAIELVQDGARRIGSRGFTARPSRNLMFHVEQIVRPKTKVGHRLIAMLAFHHFQIHTSPI
jgi:hypothetical protein